MIEAKRSGKLSSPEAGRTVGLLLKYAVQNFLPEYFLEVGRTDFFTILFSLRGLIPPMGMSVLLL